MVFNKKLKITKGGKVHGEHTVFNEAYTGFVEKILFIKERAKSNN